MQLGFGTGVLWGTQLTDNAGTAIANPTPQRFGVLQEGTIDISGALKELYGQKQFPVAIGRAAGKITLAAKAARIQASLFNAIFFGVPAGVTTTRVLVANDEAASIPATPFTVTVTNSATYTADLGVYFSATGLPLTRVASGPTTGQYSVSAGVYTFAAADTLLGVLISYQYTGTGKKIAYTNQLMGYAPTFSADLYVPYQGKSLVVHLYSCISDKLNIGTKQQDFMVPDFSAQAFANASDQVIDISTDE